MNINQKAPQKMQGFPYLYSELNFKDMTNLDEKWLFIPDCSRKYSISNIGNVRREKYSILQKNGSTKTFKPKLLKKQLNSTGYLWVNLVTDSGKKFYFIHRLVARCFLSNKNNFDTVNHKDGIKTNNITANLEWCNRKQNIRHAFDNKLMCHKGIKNSQAKVNNELVIEMRSLKGHLAIKEIAKRFNMSKRATFDIVNNKSWKHI